MTPNEERMMTAIVFLVLGIMLGMWFGFALAETVQPFKQEGVGIGKTL